MKYSKTTIEVKKSGSALYNSSSRASQRSWTMLSTKPCGRTCTLTMFSDVTVAFITAEASQGELASLAGEPSHDSVGIANGDALPENLGRCCRGKLKEAFWFS